MITDLDNDVFGNTVTLSSDGVTDTYTVGGSNTYSFPTGTPTENVYLYITIQKKMLLFSEALQDWSNNIYSLDTKFQFLVVYLLAQQNGLTNRVAYIQPLITWANAIVDYGAQYSASIAAMTDPNQILTTDWDFTQIGSVPQVTLFGAIQINS